MESKTDTLALKEHCFFCFDVIMARLNGKQQPAYPSVLQKFSSPLFVTWTITQSDDLRGCIGTFAEFPIDTTLGKYAQISAFEDSRFSPISLKEVESLTCAVSLLVNFEDAANCMDWTVGTHGIIIDFKAGSQSYNGTFLPQVASEQGWDKEMTLKYLIRKTGYKQSDYEQVFKLISLKRYQSSKIKASFKDYQDWKAKNPK